MPLTPTGSHGLLQALDALLEGVQALCASGARQAAGSIAARMLADGADSVAKVAQNVGYDSQAAFNRTFKKVAGAPPATWRRQRDSTAKAR